MICNLVSARLQPWVQVWFVQWADFLDYRDNYFIDILKRFFPDFAITLDKTGPLVVFCRSCMEQVGTAFGRYATLPNVVLVNVLDEIFGIPAQSDFQIGFNRSEANGDGVYLPWAFMAMMLMTKYGPLSLVKPLNYNPKEVAAQKTRFCAFVFTSCTEASMAAYSPTQRGFRLEVAKKLSEYKFVHAPGRCMHNVDDPDFKPMHAPGVEYRDRYQNALEYFRPYKFVFAMENTALDGYLTEKLPGAMLAGAVPIYWGDPAVNISFNPASFININGLSVQEAVERIIQLDNDDDKYMAMLSQPWLPNNKLDPEVHLVHDETIMARGLQTKIQDCLDCRYGK